MDISYWCTVSLLHLNLANFFIDMLVVFGGANLLENRDLYYDTLETFNGNEWTVEKLEFAIGKHAMVQLPCPI
jgi:hypothetical protein